MIQIKPNQKKKKYEIEEKSSIIEIVYIQFPLEPFHFILCLNHSVYKIAQSIE